MQNHSNGAKNMYSVAKMCVHSCRVAKKAPHEAFGLHYLMFIPTLSNLCTPEQRDKWLPLASSFKVVGTYAQTEMGHGQSFSFLWNHGICAFRFTGCHESAIRTWSHFITTNNTVICLKYRFLFVVMVPVLLR